MRVKIREAIFETHLSLGNPFESAPRKRTFSKGRFKGS